jgi:hypothetical protein
VNADLPISLSMDGNTKASHYRKCGASTRGLASTLETYFGVADKDIRQRHNAGTLTLDSLTALQGPSQPTAATEAEAECTTEIHCARVDVAHQPVGVDVCGVIGTVCAHTVPVRGGFADMLVYECYSFYIVMLVSLLKRLGARPCTVRDVFVDFACKLEKSWNKFVAAGMDLNGRDAMDDALADHCKHVRLLVNWMHAEGHTLDCQLQHSGRYADGSGRRYGEGTEQLWAQLKVL